MSLLAILALGCGEPNSFRVPGGHMEPNISVGGRIKVNRAAFGRAADIQRGDVVVFQAPAPVQKLTVMRIVGLPGERVSANQGRVTIDRTPLTLKIEGETAIEHSGQAAYKIKLKAPCDDMSSSEEILLPANTFFLIGDNRCASLDSRVFGPVEFSEIKGRVDLGQGSAVPAN